MGHLVKCADTFSLDDLAARVCRSSNFRFAWQFFHSNGIAPQSLQGVRSALDSIIATSDLHQFLREFFQPMYDDAFKIEPLHEHCQVVPAADEFEGILASAAGDHLGAYSRELRPANASEIQEIRELYASLGSYGAYQMLPGEVPDCPTCRTYNNQLFTNWFYGVAWDWCLFTSWPSRELFWMGCLTDTD
jgi:hypothetical protein